KPGGKLYVQLYRRRPAWIHAVNVALRAVTTRMSMGLLYRLCYVATPVHALLSRLMHFLRGEPAPPKATARERAVQMFDNYSPKYQYRHTVTEILELFRSAGYGNLKDVTLDNEARHMLAVLGIRSAPSHSSGLPDLGPDLGDGRRRLAVDEAPVPLLQDQELPERPVVVLSTGEVLGDQPPHHLGPEVAAP